MTTYLTDYELTVLNYDGTLKYAVKSYETYNNRSYATLNLELIAGLDYVDPDNSDIQGWCSPDRFIDEVQFESEVWCFMEENMIECLEDNGWTILKKGR